jgi:hypothetical protein
MDGALGVTGYSGGVFKGGNFGVVEELIFVPALADEVASVVDYDAAYGWVGGCEADAAPGEREGAVHPVGVLG